MSTNVVGVNLPEEIITEILSRLPVTSLCRLKCVSHLWLTLISDPQFAKIHLIRSRPRERIILVNRDPCPGALYSVDYGNDVPISTKLDFPEFSVEHAFVFGSCNGLLFIVDLHNYSMFLFNPTTRNVKKLPDWHFFFDSSGYNQFGFGYDSFNDSYKLVLLNYCMDISKDAVVSVYSLNTNMWRRLQNYPKWVNTTNGVSVNGRVHWLATGTDLSNNYSPAIIVFDLADENFREMPLPITTKNDDDSVWNENRLAVVGGCLCYFVNKSKIQKDFWIMNEYGVTESWTKIRFNIPHNYISQSCLPGEDKFLFSVVLYTIDGEKMVLYNPKEETIREVVLSGFLASFMFFGKYVESLVSPN